VTQTNAEQETNMTSTDRLGQAAAEIVMRAAVQYLRQHDLVANVTANADLDRFLASIKQHTKAGLSAALDDAKEAFACGMDRVGEMTFRLAMSEIGVQAAKEFAAA
jgi:hypothetical protein